MFIYLPIIYKLILIIEHNIIKDIENYTIF